MIGMEEESIMPDSWIDFRRVVAGPCEPEKCGELPSRPRITESRSTVLRTPYRSMCK